MKQTRDKVRCQRPQCGYEWTPRVESPVECPKCKHYLKDDKDSSISHRPKTLVEIFANETESIEL